MSRECVQREMVLRTPPDAAPPAASRALCTARPKRRSATSLHLLLAEPVAVDPRSGAVAFLCSRLPMTRTEPCCRVRRVSRRALVLRKLCPRDIPKQSTLASVTLSRVVRSRRRSMSGREINKRETERQREHYRFSHFLHRKCRSPPRRNGPAQRSGSASSGASSTGPAKLASGRGMPCCLFMHRCRRQLPVRRCQTLLRARSSSGSIPSISVLLQEKTHLLRRSASSMARIWDLRCPKTSALSLTGDLPLVARNSLAADETRSSLPGQLSRDALYRMSDLELPSTLSILVSRVGSSGSHSLHHLTLQMRCTRRL